MANPDETASTDTAAQKESETIKHLAVEGYEFDCDTDLMDDVTALDLIHQIEDKNRISAVVPLLHFMIGDEEYDKLAAFFIKKDAEEHKDIKGYRPRFRASMLSKIYRVIVDNFDPKG